MAPTERKRVWTEKRVFFLTPQVIMNDLSRGTCPAVDVRCLVIDEAHKATGNHAYCQVVRELIKHTSEFRILALSATPGGDIKAVQQVLANLLISHIELRTEDSPDIKAYSHERKVDKIVVPLGDELTKVKAKYIRIMDVTVNRLKRHEVIYRRETSSLSKFLILKAREDFRQNPPQNLQRSNYGAVEGDFALALSLYHGYELLQLHGSRSLYNYLDGILHGDKGYGRTKSELTRNPDFNDLMDVLREKFAPPECRPSQSGKKPMITGHPKMEKLEQVVLDHFNTFNKGNGETRVMIFSQYRDSVTEITNILKQHHPIVKVMSFIGQSSAGKSTKGFTQKEQLKVMKDFREGGYNTLVSTCVGEEGLDIGDVDLIVCFDAHKSPIRLVQRMGRTGRKREGRIVMLVTEGKEEQIYNQSQYSKKSIHKAILNGAKTLHFYQNNPTMLPDDWIPKPHKMFITVSKKFKPSKAASSVNKITNMLTSNDSKGTGDGGISREEFEELKQFTAGEPPGKTLPDTASMLCLGENKQINTENNLSLSDWLPWQNRLQQTFLMDHSKQTKHFVEVVEFLELQEALDPDEDNYGQEMNIFLNETDILKPGQADEDGNTIKHFFVSNDNSKIGRRKRSLLNPNKIRRSDQLPDIEAFVLSGESDEDLPAVFDKKSESNKLDVSKNTDDDISIIHENMSLKDEIRSRNKNEKKNITKKRNFSGNSSLVEIIADIDVNDCVGNVNELSIIKEDSQDQDKSEVVMETESPETNMVNLESKIGGRFGNLKNDNLEECNVYKVDSDSEDKDLCQDFTKLLPTFFSIPSDVKNSQHEVENIEDNIYSIPAAPSLDELDMLVKDLGQMTTLPKIDLPQLISKWEKENIININRVDIGKNNTNKECNIIPDLVKDDRIQLLNNSSVQLPGNSSDPSVTNGMEKSLQLKRTTLISPNRNKLEADMSLTNSEYRTSGDLENPDQNAKVTSTKTVIKNDDNFNNFNEKTKGDSAYCDISIEPRSVNNDGVKKQFITCITDEVNHDDMEVDKFSGSDEDFLDSQANFMLDNDDILGDFPSDDSNGDNQKEESDSKCNKDGLKENKSKSINNLDNYTSVQKHKDEDISNKSVYNSKATNICKSADVSLFNDSFMNASVLEAIQTPALEDILPSPHDKSHSPEPSDKNSSLSQFTFTQALACVHDSDSMDRLLDTDSQREITLTDNEASSHANDRNNQGEMALNKVTVLPHDTNSMDIANQGEINPPKSKTMSNKSKGILSNNEDQRVETYASNNLMGNINEINDNISLIKDKTKILQPKDTHSFTVIKPHEKSDEMEMSQFDLINDIVNMDNTSDFSDDEQATELPLFDLGFDVDDDVIPPSPCLSQTFSQKTNLKNLSQSVLSSRKSLSFICDKSKLFDDRNKTLAKPTLSPTVEEYDFNKTSLEEVLERESQGFDAQNNDIITEELEDDVQNTKNTNIVNNDENHAHKQNDIDNSTTHHDSFIELDNDFEMMPVSPVLSGKKQCSQKSGTSLEKIRTTPRTSILNLPDLDSPALDDSFVVRKKRRKAMIMDSPATPTGCNNDDLEDFKTPLRPVISKNRGKFSSSSEEGSIRKKSISRKSVSFLINEFNDDLDDDFEDYLHGAPKESFKCHKNKEIKLNNDRKKSQSVKRKSKSPLNPFLVDEAEVSEDQEASSDEEEGSDLEHMEDSFVSESCTQLSQGQHEILQAIYMKSVNSPTRQPGKFKLQYDYDSNIDVYSQVPKDEESQYYEDSFVVDEEEEHTLLDGHEITILDKDNIIDNDSYVGPRTRWSKPKIVKMASAVQKSKRRRVKRIADSSSEDEHNPIEVSTMISPPNQTSTITTTKQRNRQLLVSSSDEEQESSDIMCSLKSRINNKEKFIGLTDVKLNNTGNSNLDISALKDKEDRIQRQREQQEEFKRKMVSNQNKANVSNKDFGNSDASKLSKNDTSCFSESLRCSEDSDLLLNTRKSNNKSVVIVDSREINGAQDIVSDLRFKHQLNVVAAHLDSCDYVVSVRMGVDRKQWTEFSNGSNRSKLTERVQEMCYFYEKPCLIIEKDKHKGDEKHRILHWTKYVDKTLVQLIQSKVTLFFTENQSETAAVLSDLYHLENRKNCAISCQTGLNTEQQNKVNFFRSIPNLSYVHCLFLSSNFISVGSFLNSDIQTIMKNGKMTEERACGVYSYITRTFDSQMLPSNYG